MAEPRPSTDEEAAPLLSENNNHWNEHEDEEHAGFFDKLAAATREPPSFLSKVLLGVVIFLLLLSSVFIGLFAGAEHRLSRERENQPHNTVTVTSSATYTVTRTSTIEPPKPTKTHVPKEKPCLKAECVILSASILSSLDTTQDPCEDFYQFSNGGWLASHPLPAAKASWGAFETLAQENLQIIKDIIAKPLVAPTTTPDAVSLKKLKDFYASCMDEGALDEAGLEPMLTVTRSVRAVLAGNFSTSPKVFQDLQASQTILSVPAANATASKLGLTAALSLLHTRGVPALFWFEIDGDAGRDPDFMTLQFYQEGLGLPSKEYYDEDDIVDLYSSTLERVLLALDESDETESAQSAAWPPFPWPPWGDDDSSTPGKRENKTARASRLTKEVIALEKKLANASLDLDRLFQDPFGTYNPTSYKNFTAALPEIDFRAYLAAFTPRSFPSTIVVTYPPYVDSISKLLKNTTSEVLEAYFVSRVGLSFADNLGQKTEVWKAKRSLDEVLRGLKKGAVEDREDFCLKRVEGALGFASGRFFVQEAFPGESRIKAAKVIDDIIMAFKASLPKLSWMDKESATAASEKATAIRVKVGYPFSPNTTDATSIARYYYLVKPDPKRFFDNMLSATVSDQFKKWLTLGKMRNPDSWEMFPSTVNAYFNPPANEIVFPAGILQAPFFSASWPAYLSYGAFGQVAAHELTHAFDSAGRLYNQRGKLEEWWTNSTSAEFEKRKECIAEQYSKYTVPDGKGGVIHVNGNLTSGENIGDAGLIYAYRAWKNQFEQSLEAGSEFTLPGLEAYTREQLFFISFGRIWARNMKTAAAVQRVRTDPHSPAKYRVDGTLSNIPEFAEAFKCPKKSKMNPKKRCTLWE